MTNIGAGCTSAPAVSVSGLVGCTTAPAYVAGITPWRADTGSITDANGVQGTCTTCHDVHQSLFVEGQEGLRKECQTCHVDNAGTDYPELTAKTVNHPTSVGTPANVDPASACVVCHMPKPTAGDFPMHVWRINSDVNYSTFPTALEMGIGGTATKKNANTVADDKGYANAVWVDLDLACGQCHGGTSGVTQNSAPAMTKQQLANAAPLIHTGGTLPAFGTSTCSDCHTKTLNHPATAGTPVVVFGPMSNQSTCTSCHTAAGHDTSGGLNNGVDVQVACGQCHGGTLAEYQPNGHTTRRILPFRVYRAVPVPYTPRVFMLRRHLWLRWWRMVR